MNRKIGENVYILARLLDFDSEFFRRADKKNSPAMSQERQANTNRELWYVRILVGVIVQGEFRGTEKIPPTENRNRRLGLGDLR